MKKTLITLFILFIPLISHAHISGEESDHYNLPHLKFFIALNNPIDSIFFDMDGHWMARVGSHTYSPGKTYPTAFKNAFANGGTVAAMGTQGGWIVVNNSGIVSGNLHLEHEGHILLSQAQHFLNQGEITSISFDPDGQGFAITGNGNAFLRYAPSDLATARNYARDSGRHIQHITLGPNGSWSIVAGNWLASSGVNNFRTHAEETLASGRGIKRVGVNHQGNPLIWSGTDQEVPLKDSILDDFESRFTASNNFIGYLFDNQIISFSVAILRDGEVIESRGYGTLHKDTDSYVNNETRFQLDSISKTVSALTTFALLYKYPWTNGLNIRMGSTSPWKDIRGGYPSSTSIRHLLSHTTGISPHSSPSHKINETHSPLQHLYEESILKLHQPTLNKLSWNAWESTPGSKIEYGGIPFLILEYMLEHIYEEKTSNTKKYDQIASEIIFNIMNLQRTSFSPKTEWQNNGNTVRQHKNGNVITVNNSGIPSWNATAGLVSTPEETGKIASLITGNGRFRNSSNQFIRLISSARMTDMLTRQTLSDDTLTDSGLGIGMSKTHLATCRNTDNNARIVRHGGTGGYQGNRRSQLIINTDTNEIIVFSFSANDPNDHNPLERIDYGAVRSNITQKLANAMGGTIWQTCWGSGTF